MTGPRLVFVGNQGGLRPAKDLLAQGKPLSGDQNSPFDYVIFCSCGGELGMLGGFRENSRRERTPLCALCGQMTVVDEHGQITRHGPLPPEAAQLFMKKEL